MKIFKQLFSILVRVAVSIGLLIFIFGKVDKKTLFETIKNADKGFLALAFLVFFFSYALCLFRWEMLLKAVHIHLPLKRVIISFAGGNFFNLFLPSTIGGDVMRSIDLAVHTRKTHEVIATVLLDRLSGYIGLVLLALASLLFGFRLLQDKSILLFLGIITAILISLLFTLFNKFIYTKINRLLHSPDAGRFRVLVKDLHEEMHYFRHHEAIIGDNLMLSILIQATGPLTFYLTALALGIKINMVYFFVFLPIIGAITLLPISIGGLGLRDASTIYFFAKAGVGKDMAFAMSLINFFFIVVYAAIGGLIYVLTVRHRRIQHHKTPHIHPS